MFGFLFFFFFFQAEDGIRDRSPSRGLGDVYKRQELWTTTGLSESVEYAGDGDVVHVMSSSLRERAVLPPAGHPAIDESRVPRVAVLRAEAETFRGARAHPLEEDVGGGDQVQHRLDGEGVLEVHRHARAATREQVGLPGASAGRPAGTFNSYDVRTQVGQQHRSVRAGADAGELDDPDPFERARPLTQRILRSSHAQQCDTSTVTTRLRGCSRRRRAARSTSRRLLMWQVQGVGAEIGAEFNATSRFREEEPLGEVAAEANHLVCLLYTSPSPRDGLLSRM